jgi:hypothetical protein
MKLAAGAVITVGWVGRGRGGPWGRVTMIREILGGGTVISAVQAAEEGTALYRA